jgi:hypothetical protein
VPKSILWNKVKLGFESPEGAWIEAASEHMKTTIGESAILNSMCKDKLNFDKMDNVTFWKLFSIAKWEEIYSVQLPSTATAGRAGTPASTPVRDAARDDELTEPA